MELPRAAEEELDGLLREAQRRGFLGPGPVGDHVRRALDMAEVVETPPTRAVDLGTGGGVPALPMALLWGDSSWILVESNTARAAFLRTTLSALELEQRAEVLAERAEIVGRGPNRGRADLVTARSFGGPATTAECGAPLLRTGGIMLVSEPPGGKRDRWDPDGLGLLGMTVGPSHARPTALQILVQARACPEKYPRRTGVPAKRPLF